MVTTALYRDFNYGSGNTFEIQVTPGGTYNLRIYLGAARILMGPHPEFLYDWARQQMAQADWRGPSSPFVTPPSRPPARFVARMNSLVSSL